MAGVTLALLTGCNAPDAETTDPSSAVSAPDAPISTSIEESDANPQGDETTAAETIDTQPNDSTNLTDLPHYRSADRQTEPTVVRTADNELWLLTRDDDSQPTLLRLRDGHTATLPALQSASESAPTSAEASATSDAGIATEAVESAPTRDQIRVQRVGEHVLATWREVDTHTTGGQRPARHYRVAVLDFEQRRFAAPATLAFGEAEIVDFALLPRADGFSIAASTVDAEGKPAIHWADWRVASDTGAVDIVTTSTIFEAAPGTALFDLGASRRGDDVVIAWRGNTADEATIVTSSDRGQRFEDPVKVEAPGLRQHLRVVNATDGTVLFWPDRNHNGLLARWVAADGSADEVIRLDLETDELIAGFSTHRSPAGGALVIVGIRKGSGADALFASRITHEDGFASPVRLNNVEPHDTATAHFPAVVFDPAGEKVWVAWHDLRHIIPAIYGNHSSDGGLTWQTEEQLLSPDPGKRFAMFPALNLSSTGSPMVAWTEYDDSRRRNDATVITDWPATGQYAALAPDLDALVERVREYWTLRLNAEHDKTFDFYDPFYTSRQGREGHVQARTQYRIVIHSFDIGDIEQLGPNRYRVKVPYEHEIPQFQLPDGRIVEIPRDQVEAIQDWVWIGDQWHIVYVDGMRQPIVMY
ncbi:MAG: hypothetical protein ACK4IT_05820 [Thioalkalivibrionaceae bacterium]